MFPPGVDRSPAVGLSVDADNVREVQKHTSRRQALRPLPQGCSCGEQP